MVTKRRGRWYAKLWVYGQEVAVVTSARTKKETKGIEESLKRAFSLGDASWLDPASRDACLRLCRNRGWELLPGLAVPRTEPREELTFWKAIEKCLKHPEVRHSSNRTRHEQSFAHAVSYFGKDRPIRDLWIPDIKEYVAHRLSEGAAASTISKEKAALSLMFECLMEYQLVDRNPVREVRGPTDRGKREVYVGFEDFDEISGNLPQWLQPITWTLYYTGMRRGETLKLTLDNVDLQERMIRLREDQTKERKAKRIPICKMLVPILEEVGNVRLINRKVFHINGRAPSEHSLRKPWTRAVRKVVLDPAPTIHDLRHVWKTNAMRSGMDFEIREAIVGHRTGTTMAQRYGRISDQDLVWAIDAMTFDHGKTEILVGGATRIYENHEQNTNRRALPEQSGGGSVSTTT